MEKSNSRHCVVPEGEDSAAAGGGSRQPVHGPGAAQRADCGTVEGKSQLVHQHLLFVDSTTDYARF